MSKAIPKMTKQPKRLLGGIWRRLWGRLRWHTKLIAVIAAFAMGVHLIGWIGGALHL
jgi:hypothetical protein